MNESAIIDDLLSKVDTIARLQEARKVVTVKIQVGARSGFSSDFLREYFTHDSEGTIADGAALEIKMLDDEQDPRAEDVILEHVEVAC